MRKVQKEIADIILRSQEESGMTRKEFAAHIGVSPKSLDYWRNGQRIPRNIEIIDRVLSKIGKTVTLGQRRETF